MSDDRLARLLALQEAAERICRPDSNEGKQARGLLVEETGLSPAGVDFALRHCLERGVARSTLSGLVRAQKLRNRAHVLLSSNVFVAAFRAIAVGLTQSPKTHVRASRRASVFPRLLHELSSEAFILSEDLSPVPGDPFWAYGSDSTLASLREGLPPGVEFHGHGSGMGIAVFRERGSSLGPELAKAVEGLAFDTIAFDQRGCLSPRIVLIEGDRSFAELVCNLLVDALTRAEERVPRGRLSPQEQADALRHEATMMYLGSCVVAGMGMVVLDPQDERMLIPPVGRYLHVTVCQDALPLIARVADRVTTVGIYNPEHLPGQLQERLGDRRYVELGAMQRPPFDGPVDLRKGYSFELL